MMANRCRWIGAEQAARGRFGTVGAGDGRGGDLRVAAEQTAREGQESAEELWLLRTAGRREAVYRRAWTARRGSRKGKVPARISPVEFGRLGRWVTVRCQPDPAPLMRLAWLLLLLAACAVQPMTIPPELRSCAPPATPGPPPLGRRVTTEQLRAHDAAERSARQAAEAALIACADRLIQLNELVSGGR